MTTHDNDTPRQVFDRMLRGWLSNTAEGFGEQLADDVVIETPFAPPGRHRRIDGKAAFLALAIPGRAALPVRFDEAEVVAVHDTADPATIVVEYELGGTVTTSGKRERTSFIGVLRVRDGKATHWREYRDNAAIARVLAA